MDHPLIANLTVTRQWRRTCITYSQSSGYGISTFLVIACEASDQSETMPICFPAHSVDSKLLDAPGLTRIRADALCRGGKAVMAYALNEEFNKSLRSLISVDMSPAIGKISPEFAAYTHAMEEIEAAKVRTKSEADKIFQKAESDLGTRQFLLTNTRTDPSGHLTFRIPVALLARSIPSIGDFPYPAPGQPGSPTWSGPTMFMKGEKSKYINRYNIPVAEAYFPNMRLEVLPTGHWVHAEAPGETVRLVKEFVQGVGK